MQSVDQDDLSRIFKTACLNEVGGTPLPIPNSTVNLIKLATSNSGMGETLYDLLDTALWSGFNGDDPEQPYLQFGQVIVLRLEPSITNGSAVSSGSGVKVPAILYADRYMRESVEKVKEMRIEKEGLRAVVDRVEGIQKRLTSTSKPTDKTKSFDTTQLLDVAKPFFIRETDFAKATQKEGLLIEDWPTDIYAKIPCADIAEELQAVADRVTKKFRGL